MVGTFNGNPLAMAAARAVATEVATDDAYLCFHNKGRRPSVHPRKGWQGHGLPRRSFLNGAPGCRRWPRSARVVPSPAVPAT